MNDTFSEKDLVEIENAHAAHDFENFYMATSQIRIEGEKSKCAPTENSSRSRPSKSDLTT